MPAQRRSNAIYTHYKALSCDYGGMLIKQCCEDRAGRAALTERAKRVDKTLHNYKGGRRVHVCLSDAGVEHVRWKGSICVRACQ